MNNNLVVKRIIENPLIPVYYNSDIELTKKIVLACYQSGINVFEFTNRGIEAKSVFAELVPFVKTNCKNMLLGIGTIASKTTAEEYIQMGADFIVQPSTSVEVAEVCKQHNITWIPGVITPTEIYNALALGAEIIKIFPASVMGSAYIKALRGPMPDLKIMATGGIEPTEASIKEWFGAGVNAVGLGSQLFKDFDNIDQFKNTVRNLFSYITP